VIFDLDGTLYSLPRRKLRMVLALWRDIRVLRHLGPARSRIREREFDSQEQLLEAFYAELGRRTGRGPEHAERWYRERFLARFVRLLAEQATTRPGVVELLERMRGRGTRLGVLSDFSVVDERLEALGIPTELFDDRLSVEDFGALKPWPGPFLRLAEQWGLEPSAIVVVGDREDLDAASAEAAGMGFVGVRDHGPAARVPGSRFAPWPLVVEQLDNGTASPVG
jgi:HAD superfamily hydrolase (TIGR01549 family)